MKSVTFRLEDVPPSLNVLLRMNRFVRNKDAKRWYEKIFIEWLRAKKLKFAGKVLVDVTYYKKTNRQRDMDNMVPKFILDGLKETFIVDDNIRIVAAPTWKIIVDKTIKGEYTMVTVTEDIDETPKVYF